MQSWLAVTSLVLRHHSNRSQKEIETMYNEVCPCTALIVFFVVVVVFLKPYSVEWHFLDDGISTSTSAYIAIFVADLLVKYMLVCLLFYF